MQEFFPNKSYVIYSYIVRLPILIISILLTVFSGWLKNFLSDLFNQFINSNQEFNVLSRLEVLIPILVGIIIFISILMLVYYFIQPIMNKKCIYIRMEDQGMYYENGWFFKSKVFIPYDTIQQYSAKSNLISEQFDGAMVTVSTSFLETDTQLLAKKDADAINAIMMAKKGLIKNDL